MHFIHWLHILTCRYLCLGWAESSTRRFWSCFFRVDLSPIMIRGVRIICRGAVNCKHPRLSFQNSWYWSKYSCVYSLRVTSGLYLGLPIPLAILTYCFYCGFSCFRAHIPRRITVWDYHLGIYYHNDIAERSILFRRKCIRLPIESDSQLTWYRWIGYGSFLGVSDVSIISTDISNFV